MFRKKGSLYFPLEIEKILAGDGGVVYDRNDRGVPYFYLELKSGAEVEADESAD